jgi:hypothetical protein
MCGGRLSIQSAPASGCVFFEREIGAGDEPGPPCDSTVIVLLIGIDQLAPAPAGGSTARCASRLPRP